MSSTTENTTRDGRKQYTRHHPLKPSLIKGRSAITNGARTLPDIDGRSAWARRLRDLVAASVADLGGPDNVSHHELLLIRRASMLALQLELQEHYWATECDGQASPTQVLLYQTVTNTLRRTLEALGLRRRARDVTPSLTEYINGRCSLDEVEDFEEADA